MGTVVKEVFGSGGRIMGRWVVGNADEFGKLEQGLDIGVGNPTLHAVNAVPLTTLALRDPLLGLPSGWELNMSTCRRGIATESG